MTKDDLEELIKQCKPTPYMIIGNSPPISQQENTNGAWETLGKKMGFVSSTVLPSKDKGLRFFSAVTRENDEQRKEREYMEKKTRINEDLEALDKDLNIINKKIIDKQNQLDELK